MAWQGHAQGVLVEPTFGHQRGYDGAVSYRHCADLAVVDGRWRPRASGASQQREVEALNLVVTMGNKAYLPIMNGWYERACSLQLNHTTIALDWSTRQYLHRQRIPYRFNRNLTTRDDALPFGSGGFQSLGIVKCSWIRNLLLENLSFAFVEMDVALVRNPFDCTIRRDCFTQMFDLEIQSNIHPSDSPPMGHEVNIGVFWIRSCASTVQLWQKVIRCMTHPSFHPCGENLWDQALISKLLWSSNGTWNGLRLKGQEEQEGPEDAPIDFHTLDPYAFPTGGSPWSMGIVPKRWYDENHRRPTLVHCTGRTRIEDKKACLEWNWLNY